jgi:hypothetical protein
VLQEIPPAAPTQSGTGESDSSVTGTYRGQPVTGQAYVEQLGDWK